MCTNLWAQPKALYSQPNSSALPLEEGKARGKGNIKGKKGGTGGSTGKGDPGSWRECLYTSPGLQIWKGTCKKQANKQKKVRMDLARSKTFLLD